ncbi:MAG TPA: DUF4419 domain-containing protein [Candidatus Obscuribacterales bacterium]
MTDRTFCVSDVKVATSLLPATTHRQAFQKLAAGSKFEALSSPDAQVVKPLGFHVLIEAAHRAYSRHYPLVLTPDAIWVTIAQGFANHINQNAEQYRDKFVAHKDSETIEIYRPDFSVGNPDNDWPSCFDDFGDALRERLGEERYAQLVSDFSTTGSLERVVSIVVLMDTVQSYFNYAVWTECGIPRITLTGTPEDWQSVLDKTKSLYDFGGLEWWLDKATPVLDQFVAAAKGHVDSEFWQGLYKSRLMGSGSESVDGALMKLIPYIKRWGDSQRNPLLEDNAATITTENLPASLSTVPFKFDLSDYHFVAGLTAVSQDADGTLAPMMGWAVRPPGGDVDECGPFDDED